MYPATGRRIIDLNELSPQPIPQNRLCPPIVNPPPPPANCKEYVHVRSPTTLLDSYHSLEYSPMVPYYPDIPLLIQPSRSVLPLPLPTPQYRLRSRFTYENQIVPYQPPPQQMDWDNDEEILMAHNTYAFFAYIEDELQTYAEAVNAQ